MKSPTESKIQQEIWVYFNNKHCLKHHSPRCSIFAIPNGGKRDAREAKALKNTGVKSGVADLQVLLPKRTVFVEVKTTTGYQSDTQKEFQQVCKGLDIEYYVVRSLQDFIDLNIVP
jgi:hypothetical protein